MNRLGIVLALVVLVGFSNQTTLAAGDGFSHGSSFSINPDGISGSATGWGGISNPSIEVMECSLVYNLNPNGGQSTIVATGFVAGGFGGFPIPEGRLQSSATLSLDQVPWQGQEYVFDSPVSLSLSLDVNPYQYDDHVNGYFNCTTVAMTGAIPLNSFSSLQFFGDGNPYFWQLTFTSEWLITTSFEPVGSVPAPGALSLFGLAGYASRRRR